MTRTSSNTSHVLVSLLLHTVTALSPGTPRQYQLPFRSRDGIRSISPTSLPVTVKFVRSSAPSAPASQDRPCEKARSHLFARPSSFLAPMSIDLFFPENRDRAKRVQELVDDVSGMQNAIISKTNQLDEADARIVPLLNDLMRKHGLRTVSELIDRVVDELPPELQQAIRELLADLSKTSANLEKAFGAITSITLAAAIGGVSAKVLQLVKSNAVFVSTRLTMKAFTVALRGGANALEEAAELFKAASKASSTLSTSFETTTSLGKALKFVKTTGKVLTALGIVADVALTVIAAVEGAKQRDELQEQIKENFERRVSVALLTALASAAVAMNGNLESILLLESLKGKDPSVDDSLQQAIDLLTEPIASSVEDVWDLISYEQGAETWTILDQNRGSWTDEDPSLKKVIAEMESVEDIAFT